MLERIAARHHRRVDRVFEDWLRMVDAMLTMMPAHVAAVAQTGQLAQDPPEIAALFGRIRDTYPHLTAEFNFGKAAGLLLESAATGYFDIVGTVYMALNAENKYAGQYFTPWPVARMMAHLTLGDAPGVVIERLIAAADAAANAPDASAGLKASRLMGRLRALRDDASLLADFPADPPGWLAEHWAEIAPHYVPVSVMDPALGSGALMLAVAELFPKWMLYLGLVQFYGTDIDETCVLMARLNAKLYGLNGFGGQIIREFTAKPLRSPGKKGENKEKLGFLCAFAVHSGAVPPHHMPEETTGNRDAETNSRKLEKSL